MFGSLNILNLNWKEQRREFSLHHINTEAKLIKTTTTTINEKCKNKPAFKMPD